MHELSIAEALRQTLLEYQQENGGKVLKLFVSIGRLGGIDPEALEYVWPMAMGECDENVRHCQLVIKSLSPLSERNPPAAGRPGVVHNRY